MIRSLLSKTRQLSLFRGFSWKAPELKDKYDVLILGGGTGGITCAKELAANKISVALLDYVSPSPTKGSTWGLGGTCTNVGCVPKKLMHTSGIIKHLMDNSKHYGWNVEENMKHKLSWDTLRDNIQAHIKQSNFSSGVKLKELGIDYINAKGIIVDPNTAKYRYRDNEKYPERIVKFNNLVIATGTRPNIRYTGAGGENSKDFWITSDDLFTLEEEPGKTLVFGGGYIGVECAGFLKDLGYDVTLISNSGYLAGFDKDISRKVIADLKEKGLKIFEEAKIDGIKKDKENLTEVTFSHKGEQGKKVTKTEKFKTLLLAIGRMPQTASFGVQASGIKVSKSGHIVGRDEEKERSISHSHIYTVGDVCFGSPQLMPVAQKAGLFLGKRLSARIVFLANL